MTFRGEGVIHRSIWREEWKWGNKLFILKSQNKKKLKNIKEKNNEPNEARQT